jgi:hypothetical protein
LAAIIERVQLLVGTPIAYVMLVHEGDEKIVMRAAGGVTDRAFDDVSLALGAGLGGVTAQNRRPYYTSDYLNDRRFTHEPSVDAAVRKEGVKSILGCRYWPPTSSSACCTRPIVRFERSRTRMFRY